MKDFRKELLRLRKESGLTLKEIEGKAGFTRQALRKIEKGGDVNLKTLAAFLKAYGLDLAGFFQSLKRDQPHKGEEQRQSYGRRDYDDIWSNTDNDQRDRIKKAVIVLTSKDEVTKIALEHNIIAFHRTIVLLQSKRED